MRKGSDSSSNSSSDGGGGGGGRGGFDGDHGVDNAILWSWKTAIIIIAWRSC